MNWYFWTSYLLIIAGVIIFFGGLIKILPNPGYNLVYLEDGYKIEPVILNGSSYESGSKPVKILVIKPVE